ncbi:uncharacterized protein [Epargyreus clarus]|uniref:uncharacterized protein n=1 Tax=Epargyreus clarus TaxID=520877 RepID=UPI003C301869
MKRRRDKILELALNDKKDTMPDDNKSCMTPRRRRYSIHEIPSPRAFVTVTTTDSKESKPSKRSKRAKSLFPESQYNNSEKLAEPLVDSLDEYDDTSNQRHEDTSVCKDRVDSCVISTSSASPYQHNFMSLQSQESSNSNSNVLIEPQPSTSKLSSPANENFYSLRRGVKTRGGVAKQKGIKIIKSQKLEIKDGKCKLTDLVEKNASNDDLNLDRSLQDLDIINEMRSIFKEDNKEEKVKVTPPSKKKRLSDEDLLKILELDEDDLQTEVDQEILSDDCLFSDASEDATQESEYETQMSEDETQSQVSQDAAQVSEDNNISSNGPLQVNIDEWKSEYDHNIAPIEFNGHENNLKILPGKNEPWDYFELIVTDDFYKTLVGNINDYASRLLSNIRDPKSRIRLWKDVTVPEIKVFLGILFHMGTIRLNRITDYWKKDPLFNITAFSNHMSRNRFLLIMRSLNFGDDLSDNRLSKINNLIKYFNQRMEEIYCPSKNLAIDESMVLFRGRLIFRQYLKGKKHPYGIKLYILTDEHGVVLKTIVYAGASDTLVGGDNHSEKVVLNLLNNYLNQGYSVYMDNFYNSVNLAHKILNLKTYCTGTLRTASDSMIRVISQKQGMKQCVASIAKVVGQLSSV